MSWTLSDIRTKMRALVRRSSTTELSESAANGYINDYYRYDFPQQVNLERMDSAWTQALSATDDGEYSLSTDIVEMSSLVTLNGCDELQAFYSPEEFWRCYPANEDYLADPTLVVGTSNAAYVANSAFTYSVGGYQYSKAAAETALSGDAVPVNKYGAWMLTIDADGDVSIVEADDNATGYATPGKAVEGIATADVTDAVMGFVTAICTAGAFTPGTTELNTGASVTATFTDGHPDLRGRPESILMTVNAGKVYVRPKPDDIYLLKSIATLQRPTAMSSDTDTPADEAWGMAIAVGAAIKFLASKEMETELILELRNGAAGVPTPGCLMYELARIRQQQMLQNKLEIKRYW